MTPLRLKLTGFAGIASGRGKNEIEIDFATAVPHEAQIVALSGPNGAGKTTVMDNLHPYRLMPSRASTPSPGAFSFYEHIVGGQGAKELDWSHEGITYRSVLTLRSTAKTKKQECYLFTVKDGVASPWACPATGKVSDGKADTYDRAVEAILGKPEVFFAAQFSAQGKQPLGKMTAGEVKTLLGQMLGMERITALGAQAQGVVRELKPYLAQAQETIAKLQVQAQDGHVQAQVQQLREQQMQMRQMQTALQRERDAAQEALGAARRDAQAQQAISAQRAAAKQQIDAAMQEHARRSEDLAQDQRQRVSEATQQQAQAMRSVQSLMRQCEDTAQRIAQALQLADKADALAQTQAEATRLQEKHQALLAQAAECEPAVAQLRQVRHAMSELQESLARAQSGGEHIASSLQKARETASLLGDVPCHGTDMAGRCQLLAQAHAAAHEVPALQARLHDARSAYKAGRTRLDVTQARLDELLRQEERSRSLSQQVQEVLAASSRCQALLAQRQFVEDAVQQLPGMQQAQRQLREELQQAQVQAAHAQTRIDALRSEQQQQIQALKEQHQEQLQRLHEQLQSLPQAVGQEQVQAAQQQVAAIEQRQARAEQQAQAIAHAMVQAQATAQHAAQAQAELGQAQAGAEVLGQEIAQWTLLAKALGTDGIVAMQIDDAGPAIALLANQLLADCYGGRFQISLVTQAQTAAGIHKEAFLIQVEDTHRGETKLLDAMSGGERVWINECLVRALALHMAQAADARYETLFSDESDGPLDAERKRQYMQMKRAVLERGGYSREYLITQTPELLHLCDAVIDVASL